MFEEKKWEMTIFNAILYSFIRNFLNKKIPYKKVNFAVKENYDILKNTIFQEITNKIKSLLNEINKYITLEEKIIFEDSNHKIIKTNNAFIITIIDDLIKLTYPKFNNNMIRFALAENLFTIEKSYKIILNGLFLNSKAIIIFDKKNNKFVNRKMIFALDKEENFILSAKQLIDKSEDEYIFAKSLHNYTLFSNLSFENLNKVKNKNLQLAIILSHETINNEILLNYTGLTNELFVKNNYKYNENELFKKLYNFIYTIKAISMISNYNYISGTIYSHFSKINEKSNEKLKELLNTINYRCINCNNYIDSNVFICHNCKNYYFNAIRKDIKIMNITEKLIKEQEKNDG